MTIEQLAIKYGSDKRGEIHGFTKWYEMYFSGLSPKKILEIGVFGGASVKMWYDYFKKTKIVGVDIDPELVKYSNDRTNIYIGDQSDKKFLNNLCKVEGSFDIIIDDGGHRMAQQIISFEALFPNLSNGGLYVIEDLHTSYWSEWQDEGFVRTTDFIKRLIDEVQLYGLNGYGNPHSEASKKDKDGYGYDKVKKEFKGYLSSVEWIHVHKSIVFIKKRDIEL